MGKIKVLLIDDHPVVRTGVAELLRREPDFEVVGEASSGMEALSMVGVSVPEVVVLDLSMPDKGGIEVSRMLRDRYPNLGIVIFSVHDHETYVLQALQAGATAYVRKGAECGEIVNAIRSAAKGEYFLCSQLNHGIIDIFLRRRSSTIPEEPYSRLSEREQQVFRLLVEGHSTSHVADILCVSPKTAEKHRANVMRKLNCPDFFCLVKFAVRIGLVDPDNWKV
jgi:DNA-binding NarL/FixJ family response regulator